MRLFAESPQIFLEENCAPGLFKPNGIDLNINTTPGYFSFFSRPVTNIKPSSVINAQTAFETIISSKYAIQTNYLRTMTDKVAAQNYKARNFDFCCFSGTFSKRSVSGLLFHSGFLTIDFDHIENVCSLKRKLIENPSFNTVLAFTSPSGDGLKWIVEIDITLYTHALWFYTIASYLKANYKVEADPSGKDVSRCCFLPCDPNAYINPKYLA